MLYLENCQDTKYETGIDLFPAILISELHEVRTTIEAFAAKEVFGNLENRTAAGIMLGVNGYAVIFQVRYENFVQYIRITAYE